MTRNLFIPFTTLVLLFLSTINSFSQKLSVKDLTVEHLVNPFSIDRPNPRFSWKVISDIKDTRQRSYEIRDRKSVV